MKIGDRVNTYFGKGTLIVKEFTGRYGIKFDNLADDHLATLQQENGCVYMWPKEVKPLTKPRGRNIK